MPQVTVLSPYTCKLVLGAAFVHPTPALKLREIDLGDKISAFLHFDVGDKHVTVRFSVKPLSKFLRTQGDSLFHDIAEVSDRTVGMHRMLYFF